MFSFLSHLFQQFNKLNQLFTAYELDKRDDCAEIQAALGQITGATSVSLQRESFVHFCCTFYRNRFNYICLQTESLKVPRVFVNGKFIGGGTDVKKLNETGELKKLLD